MTMSGPANLQMAKFARQMTDSRATPIHCAARPPQRAFTLRAGPPSSRTAQGSFDQALSTLKQACETKSVSIEDVKSALAAAEAEGPAVEDFPRCIDGTWRLVFALPAPIDPWAYIPVVENAAIDTAAGTISLTSYLGPFTFTFGGQCRFVSDGGACDMVFSFDSSCISVFGKDFKSQRTPKEKTYSFYMVQGDVAAVNSSATGGKTLMWRVPPKGANA